MSCEEWEQSLCGLPATGGHAYFLLSTLKQGTLQLVLCDTLSAWKATVSEAELRKMSKKVKMEFGEYLSQCRKALTRRQLGNAVSFQYQVTRHDATDDVTLVWKKHMATENIKFQLGSVSMQTQDNLAEVLRHMFTHCIEGSTALQERISGLQSDNERLAAERASALKRLDKCVAAKESLEADLMSKFVQVLNKKKAKLRSLQQSASEEVSQSLSADTHRGQAAARAGSSDGEHTPHSDSEYNTDDDQPSPAKRSRPQKGAGLYDSADEDSLLLDAGTDNMDQTVAVVRRRRRGGRESQKKTPSRPILPKVTSAEKVTPARAGPSATRVSMRKSASSRSTDIDPEDLLDDMA